MDANAWPDPACDCAGGVEPNAQGQCPGPLDVVLFDEVNQANPAVASVVALLDDGANPNFVNSDGVYALVAAATLLHADVISILITAGANPRARSPDSFKPVPNLIQDALDASDPAQARRVAEAMRHFGDGVAQATLTSSAYASTYHWGGETSDDFALFSLLSTDYDAATDAEVRTAIKFVAEYLRDQGMRCGRFLGANHVLCAAGRVCPATGRGIYACSACSGYSLLGRDGALCVSGCRGGEIADEGWPDAQCQCPDGAVADEFGCASSDDDALAAEVQKPEPSLVSVRALLGRGARANITLAGGLPLIFAAVTLGHAQVVSVLITAGAHPETRHAFINDPRFLLFTSIPERILQFAFRDGEETAQMMIHFGEAVKVAAATSTVAFRWDDAARFENGLFTFARDSYMRAAPAKKEELSLVGGYLLDQGAQCTLAPDSAGYAALCQSRRRCALSDSSFINVHSCGVCSGNAFRSADGGSCLAQCAGSERPGATAGWGERQCECADGALDAIGCPSRRDPDLTAEIEKSPPDLPAIRALLEQGARPNITTSAGVPVLAAAAAMGNADLVSILITAGADPNAKALYTGRSGRSSLLYSIPGYAANRSAGYASDRAEGYRRGAEVLVHFGDALKDSRYWFDWRADEFATADSYRDFFRRLRTIHNGEAQGSPLRTILQGMAGYAMNQGAVCPSAYATEAICASRPSCSARAGAAVYSCAAACAGLPLRSADGSCVSACERGEEADASGWPDLQCQCRDGAGRDEFGCLSPHTMELVAEVQKRSPSLATVRFLLDGGARPNITNSVGVPVMLVAATLLHAQVVSVLITAGANVSVSLGLRAATVNEARDLRALPLLLAEQAHAGNLEIGRSLADTYFHFGDAAGAEYGWREILAPGAYLASETLGVLALIEKRGRAGEGPFLEEIAGYIRGAGGRCPDGNFYSEDISNSPVCALSPPSTCPRWAPLRDEICVPKTGDFGPLSDAALCGAFGGTIESGANGGRVCAGMDANDTFCILNSTEAFPCRGLFKHLRKCNMEFNREALNPFFCGRVCPDDEKAVGAGCVAEGE